MSSFNGFKEVAADKLDTLDFNPYKKIGKEWFLVTAGDESGWLHGALQALCGERTPSPQL